MGTLAKVATIVLALPTVVEACPMGLAPTTSTTMTLALGDCLAIALLERMGMTSDQFKVFHPGGKLGKKLLPVSELMDKKSDLPFVKPTQTMDTVIVTLTEKNMGCVIVSNDNSNVLGLITDGDLKRHMAHDFLTYRADKIMTPHPKKINGNILAGEAIDIMLNRHASPITSLLVIDDNGSLIRLLRLQTLLAAGVA